MADYRFMPMEKVRIELRTILLTALYQASQATNTPFTPWDHNMPYCVIGRFTAGYEVLLDGSLRLTIESSNGPACHMGVSDLNVAQIVRLLVQWLNLPAPQSA